MVAMRSLTAWSTVMPRLAAVISMFDCSRSVAKGPGCIKLIVTLAIAIAAVDHDLASGLCETLGAGAAQSFAGGADDGLAAGNAQIHGELPNRRPPPYPPLQAGGG